MRYFITGGAGFIGSNLCSFLLDDRANGVTVFDNFTNGRESFLSPHSKHGNLRILKGDVLDIDALRKEMTGHDLVFHLAANADIALSAADTALDLKQTVLATYNVLESMRHNKISQLVFSSGSGVYGDVGEIAPREDFGPLYPVSMYGATKLSAEALISAFSHLFGIRAWIFRFANVIGPNQTHGVGYDFIRKLRRDASMLEILGNGSQSKSYIHVDDVLTAIFRGTSAAEAPVAVYNVGTGDYMTVRRIAEIVVEEMGLPGVRMVFGETTYGWKGDVPVVRLNDDKIRALGWRPKYGSEDAMRRAVKQMLTYM